jgi:hypothetical protein
MLTGPEGSVKINDKDTILTGTNLNNNKNNENYHNELKDIKNLLNALIQKPQHIYLDGVRVGSVLTTGKAGWNM